MSSVLLLARAWQEPCQLADRAFGAQRFSGGRTGRRFAPPSAAGFGRSDGAALRAASGGGYHQRYPQKTHFEHFRGSGMDTVKSSIRSFILSILEAWVWIWSKVASEGSF